MDKVEPVSSTSFLACSATCADAGDSARCGSVYGVVCVCLHVSAFMVYGVRA